MADKKEWPWEYENGSTDVDGFLEAYKKDDNVFWMTPMGHIMNVLDELIYRLEEYS